MARDDGPRAPQTALTDRCASHVSRTSSRCGVLRRTRRSNQRGVEGHIPSQVGFGQRRPFVRRLMLGADQGNSPIGALVSQRDGGRGAGQAGADDHVRRGHQTSICSASPSTRCGYTLTGASPEARDLPRPHIELGAVAHARDGGARQVPFFSKRALLMRAGVVERVVGASHIGDSDSYAAYIDCRDAACRYLTRFDGRHKL